MSFLGKRVIIALLAFCLSACGNSEGKLNGEVFIVTKGGQNIKLGLVNIKIIPESDILAFVDKKREEAIKEIGKRESIYKKAEQEANEAKVAEEKALQKMKASEPYYNEKLVKDRVDKLNFWKYKLDKWAILRAECDFYKSDKYYFDGLPAGIVSVKTNADGKFSITLKNNTKYALAAQAQRTIGGSFEKYYWLIWINLENNVSQNIMLSNDNLMEAFPTNAVVSNSLMSKDDIAKESKNEVINKEMESAAIAGNFINFNNLLIGILWKPGGIVDGHKVFFEGNVAFGLHEDKGWITSTYIKVKRDIFINGDEMYDDDFVFALQGIDIAYSALQETKHIKTVEEYRNGQLVHGNWPGHDEKTNVICKELRKRPINTSFMIDGIKISTEPNKNGFFIIRMKL